MVKTPPPELQATVALSPEASRALHGPSVDLVSTNTRSAVDRQLGALFGESIFGAAVGAPTEAELELKPYRRRRTSTWLRAAAALLACAALASGVAWLVRRGSAEKATAQRAEWDHELALLLQDGDLPRAARLVSLLRGDAKHLRSDDPHLARLLRAEAALYRYYDAEPARLRAIEAALAKLPEERRASITVLAGAPASSSSPLQPSSLRSLAAASLPKARPPAPVAAQVEPDLVSMVVASRHERAERVTKLDSVCERLSEDAECFYVLASALEQHGDIDAARLAWNRSWNLGPAWLPHRFEQASFEHHHGGEEAAARLVAQMKRMAPSAPWTDLAWSFASSFSVSPNAVIATAPAASADVEVTPAPASSAPRSDVVQPPSPVQDHRARLLEAVAAARRGDVPSARRLLASAVAAVHGERAFVFDAFDWLIDERAFVLAGDLTGMDQWPATSPIAKSMVARLTDASLRTGDESSGGNPVAGAGGSKVGNDQGRTETPGASGKGKHRAPARKPPRGKGHR